MAMDAKKMLYEGVATFGHSPRKQFLVKASLKEKLKPWLKERVLA